MSHTMLQSQTMFIFQLHLWYRHNTYLGKWLRDKGSGSSTDSLSANESRPR